MARTALLLVTLGTVLIGPVLCLGGALEHDCACAELDGSCEHEDDCPGDPCHDTLFVAGSGGFRPHGPDQTVASLPAWTHAAQAVARGIDHPPSSWHGGDGRRLPFPSSDRPLRI